jgi:TonB-dependent receptor
LNLGYRIHEVLYSANGFGREQLASGTAGPAYIYSVAPSDQTFNRTREGGGLKLDYKLSENTRFYANLTYNKHLEHGLFGGNTFAATWQTNQVVATRDASGVLTGTGGIVPGYTDQVTDVRPVAASSLNLASTENFKEGETQTVQFGAKHRYHNLDLDYDVYQSKSKSNYANNATMSWRVDGIGFRVSRADTYNPTVTQTGGPDITNLDNYNTNVYTKSRNAGWDQYEGAAANLKKRFETVVPAYIKMGVRLRDQGRELRNTTYRTSYVGPDGVMGLNPATGRNDDNLAQFGVAKANWPDDEALGGYPTNLPFPVKPNEGKNTLFVEKILAQSPQYFRQQIANDVSGELSGNQSFKEKINGYYMMGSVDLGKLTITGGVRVETTKTKGVGALQIITPEEKARRAAWVGAVTEDETRRRTYEEYYRRQSATGDYRTIFPGVHFKFEPIPRLVTRLSYATNIGRPAIGQLIPRTTANIDNQTVSTSNPSLKPQLANNFDATAEYYFEPSGVLSAGVFLKEMKNFIYTLGGQIVPAGVDNGFGGEYAGYTMTSQRNGGSAKVKGIELSYSQQFTFLPGVWRGLGAFANLTRMSAEGNYGNGNAIALAPTAKIAGFNPFVANMGVSYIKDKVSVRFQYNMRGRYLSSYNANESRQVYLSARNTLDIKTVYHFSRRYDVYLDVVNVLQVADRQAEFNGGRPQTIGYLSRQVLFGINARM